MGEPTPSKRLTFGMDLKPEAGIPALMTPAEIGVFYELFYSGMSRDIAHEIEWQRINPTRQVGNVLCALGLVVYTETLGRLATRQLERRYEKDPAAAFWAFLGRMADGEYARWALDWEAKHKPLSFYDVLRNGLAHEYLPKVHTKLLFYFGEKFGLGVEPDYDLVLKMEAYYRDFSLAAEALFKELRSATEFDGGDS